MKTTSLAALTIALSMVLVGSLAAAPRGKHVIEPYPHRHGAQGASKAAVEHTALKWIGPKSKGFRNPHYSKR